MTDVREQFEEPLGRELAGDEIEADVGPSELLVERSGVQRAPRVAAEVERAQGSGHRA